MVNPELTVTVNLRGIVPPIISRQGRFKFLEATEDFLFIAASVVSAHNGLKQPVGRTRPQNGEVPGVG